MSINFFDVLIARPDYWLCLAYLLAGWEIEFRMLRRSWDWLEGDANKIYRKTRNNIQHRSKKNFTRFPDPCPKTRYFQFSVFLARNLGPFFHWHTLGDQLTNLQSESGLLFTLGNRTSGAQNEETKTTQIYPKLKIRRFSESDFGHSIVVSSPLSLRRSAFSQNPLIDRFWILKVLCDLYPKIRSPTIDLFIFPLPGPSNLNRISKYTTGRAMAN